MDRLGIVIIGYKNVLGIKRLFDSLSKVDFCGESDLTLIISIDYSGDKSVENLANTYDWKYGKKIVVAHDKNLGLRKHILSCGSYMDKYDLSAIAVLEDDIYISPEMYKYMCSAVEFYKSDSRITGISLYKHEFNINAKHPFMDYFDCGDTFFIQYAMSWGQIWLKDKWDSFIRWYNEEKWKNIDESKIPSNILKWKNSWLKYHIMYCIEQNLYFVYPRVSLSTNFSDIGAHNKSFSTSMQVKLCMNKDVDWNFTKFDDTLAVYDAFFENVNLAKFLNITNADVDLYGVKKLNEKSKYIITRKRLPYKIVKSWGLQLRPMEANILLGIPGDEIILYDLSHKEKNKKQKKNYDKIFEYDLKGINIVSFENVKYCIKFILKYIKLKLKWKKKK